MAASSARAPAPSVYVADHKRIRCASLSRLGAATQIPDARDPNGLRSIHERHPVRNIRPVRRKCKACKGDPTVNEKQATTLLGEVPGWERRAARCQVFKFKNYTRPWPS